VLAANIDLRPTFAAWAGAPVGGQVDGRSLAGVLRGDRPKDWRDAVLVEHRGPVAGQFDPDKPELGSGNPPNYEAIRTEDAVYVEYADGQREYYDLRKDPHEVDNRVTRLKASEHKRLHRLLRALATCRGAPACSAA
jgi:arylsulfatase A-like enzyme